MKHKINNFKTYDYENYNENLNMRADGLGPNDHFLFKRIGSRR